MASLKTAKEKQPGLYTNIQAKKKRFADGSGETIRKKGAEGAPQQGAFRKAEKTETKK